MSDNQFPPAILIVDDSITYRSAVRIALNNEKNIKIVGSVRDGSKAIEFIAIKIREGKRNLLKGNTVEEAFQELPQLLTLDIEMPVMGGLQVLNELHKINQELKEISPDIPSIFAIVLSSHTVEGAKVTLEALNKGAIDFIPKPVGKNQSESIEILKKDLLPRIRAFTKELHDDISEVKLKDVKKEESKALPSEKPTTLNKERYELIVIGVSTGGPKALSTFIPMLTQVVDLPILIVQHMPPLFTKSLADSLNRACANYNVREVNNNEPLQYKNIYIAPGGKHMVLRKAAEGYHVCENDNPPEKNCKPSVDVMFRSVASTFKGKILSVILTGMGNDGTAGLKALKRVGAYSIVQDKKSSVVWGMPGSAVGAGVTDIVLPLNSISTHITKIIKP